MSEWLRCARWQDRASRLSWKCICTSLMRTGEDALSYHCGGVTNR